MIVGAKILKLAAPLDAGRVKKRQGRGSGTLSYIETHDAIRAANDIFGFGAWGHEIVDLRPLDGVTVTNSNNKTGIHVGYVCIVRLTVEGCVPVSGIGYGDAVEYTQSATVTAHELAAKEAESDALKRALKNFGDQFGLALYDKDAARAGHIATAPSGASKPAASSAGNASPTAAGDSGPNPVESPAAAPVVTPATFAALARAWKALHEPFDVDAAIAQFAAHSGDVDWRARAAARLQTNIDERTAALEQAAA